MIHKTAIIEAAEIGNNCNIWHYVHIRKGAKIGNNCNIGKGVYIDKKVIIGDNCKIQNFASIYQGVTISDNVFIGPHVCFTNDKHPRAFGWDENKIETTHIREGASIGANATILPGVMIGRYAMIGAGAVVTRNIRDFALAVGNPARIVKDVDKDGNIK